MQATTVLQESPQVQQSQVSLVQEATALPQAVFASLFEGRRFIYKRQLLSSKITIFRDKSVRAVKVGSFLYVEQDKLGMDSWSERARAGECIMHIYNLTTDARVAEVVNGKIYRLQ